MKVKRIENGGLRENCYLVYDENDDRCICIDPGYYIEPILKEIENRKLKVDTILLTHGHFDHSLGCIDIQKKYGSKVYISEEDSKIVFDAVHSYANIINKTEIPTFDIYKKVGDEEVIQVLSYNIRCMSTPGHTKGGFCFYFENEKTIFTGDTLFCETYGRTDLYSGSFHDMKVSLVNKLFLLPDDTIVYPGHNESTTIGHEKIHNEIRRNNNEL